MNVTQEFPKVVFNPVTITITNKSELYHLLNILNVSEANVISNYRQISPRLSNIALKTLATLNYDMFIALRDGIDSADYQKWEKNKVVL